MSDIDSKWVVRAVERRAVAARQRDIENVLAHEAARAVTDRTVTVRRWRRVLGHVGHLLVAISERPLHAPGAKR